MVAVVRLMTLARPFQYQIGFAEKTYATFSMTARNRGGHSSMPRPDNAIFDLAAAIQRLEMHTFPVETNEITLTYFARTAPFLENEVGDAMARFAADPSDESAIETLRGKPEYVGTLGTTCIPTMLEAGHAENALPRSATATVNMSVFSRAIALRTFSVSCRWWWVTPLSNGRRWNSRIK